MIEFRQSPRQERHILICISTHTEVWTKTDSIKIPCEILPVNIPSMPDGDYHDEQSLIMNFIYDTIIPYANPPGGASGEFQATCRAGNIRQISNGCNNAIPIFAVNLGKLLLSRTENVQGIIQSWHS